MTDDPDDEALLSRFRRWLEETRAQGREIEATPSEPPGPEVGLFRLVEEFTALRHEVKLETRSARGLQDQVESLLPAFRQAIEQFKANGPKEEQAAFAAARPLAEAIADLDEALDRGRAEVEKARHRLAVEPFEALATRIESLHHANSWILRWRLGSYHDRVLSLVRGAAESGPKLVDAMLEGYDLIQARLRRAMDSEQIRRIECVGRPTDPERMTVVEVADSDDVPAGHVVNEVRRGYTWRGRVLRFAEVCAARSAAPPREPLEEE